MSRKTKTRRTGRVMSDCKVTKPICSHYTTQIHPGQVSVWRGLPVPDRARLAAVVIDPHKVVIL